MIKRIVNLKVAITEMYPRILWELVEDPLGSAEHILGTSDLRCLMYSEIECRQHRPSDADCRSAVHSVSGLLWSPKFHCRIQEFRHSSLDSPDESTLSHPVPLRSVTVTATCTQDCHIITSCLIQNAILITFLAYPYMLHDLPI